MEVELSMTEADYTTMMDQKDLTKTNKGRVLINLIDCSSSMCGYPHQIVREGTAKLCDAILQDDKADNPFERFITVFYNEKIKEVYESTDREAYKKKLWSVPTSGMTNFVDVFVYLQNFILNNK